MERRSEESRITGEVSDCCKISSNMLSDILFGCVFFSAGNHQDHSAPKIHPFSTSVREKTELSDLWIPTLLL